MKKINDIWTIFIALALLILIGFWPKFLFESPWISGTLAIIGGASFIFCLRSMTKGGNPRAWKILTLDLLVCETLMLAGFTLSKIVS